MRRAALLALSAFVLGRATFHLLDALFPFALTAQEVSLVVTARDGTPMRVGLTSRGERVLSTALPPRVARAVVAAEDRRFLDHNGVDLRAVLRAVFANLRGRREGASTITMQLARLMAPCGKIVQAFRALQLEVRHGKREILEAYVNRVPLGGNLRGFEAAAHAWFGKTAARLTDDEAAVLAACLPAPSRLRPDRTGARGLDPTPFPDFAPHAWQRARRSGPTTIDPPLQRAVEKAAAHCGGVDGVAIVVVENETRAIRALAGAHRPSPRVLDATGRPRSAGSTFKPLLYALAFDRGLAVLETRLLDLPWSAHDWAPTDFDGLCRGPVAAADALAASLNIPAVRLAAALPRGLLLERLRRAGCEHARSPHVDLAIGTDDVTALELAGLYAALASGGVYEPPHLDGRRGPAARICSAGAAALVTRALRRGGIACKTGTSSRRRDAWAAGYTRRFTAVVWRGRLDGRPDPSLVGARAAAPLLLDVLRAADPGARSFADPIDVAACELCPETGLRRTPACPANATAGLRPATARALAPCNVHYTLFIERNGGHLVCVRCRSGRATRRRNVAIFPPALAAWRARAGLATGLLPRHHPDCPAPLEPAATRPVIVSSSGGQVLAGGPVVVEALAAAPRTQLTILVGGRPAARTRSGRPTALALGPGFHTLTAIDSRGTCSASYMVRVYSLSRRGVGSDVGVGG